MLRRCSIAALAASLLTAFAAVTPATAPAAEVGVNPITGNAAQALDGMNQLGATWVRAFVRWDQVEPAGPGRWMPDSLANLDELTATAQLRGLKVVAVVTGAPQWANGTTRPLRPAARPRGLPPLHELARGPHARHASRPGRSGTSPTSVSSGTDPSARSTTRRC